MGRLIIFPLVRQPLVEVADRRSWEVGQQLGEVTLRVDGVAPAGAGEAAEDGGGTAAAVVAGEKAVFSIKNYSLHFSFADVVVDRHGPVVREDIQFRPLGERVADGL